MTATFEQATDEMLDVFKAAWDPTTWEAQYENYGDNSEPPTAQVPWARVVIRHGPPGPEGQSLTGGLQASGGFGTSRFSRSGTLAVQVFVPAGEGLSRSYQLTKIVADAFEGMATPRNVWFRNVRSNEVGPSGDFYQQNVLVDFTYGEIK